MLFFRPRIQSWILHCIYLHLVVMSPWSSLIWHSSLVFSFGLIWFGLVFKIHDLAKCWLVILQNVPLDLSGASSWLDWGHVFLGRIPQTWCCALLSASYQEYDIITYMMSILLITGDVNFDPDGSDGSARFLFCKLIVSPWQLINVLWRDTGTMQISSFIIFLPCTCSFHGWSYLPQLSMQCCQIVFSTSLIPFTFMNWNSTERKSCSSPLMYVFIYSIMRISVDIWTLSNKINNHRNRL